MRSVSIVVIQNSWSRVTMVGVGPMDDIKYHAQGKDNEIESFTRTSSANNDNEVSQHDCFAKLNVQALHVFSALEIGISNTFG